MPPNPSDAHLSETLNMIIMNANDERSNFKQIIYIFMRTGTTKKRFLADAHKTMWLQKNIARLSFSLVGEKQLLCSGERWVSESLWSERDGWNIWIIHSIKIMYLLPIYYHILFAVVCVSLRPEAKQIDKRKKLRKTVEATRAHWTFACIKQSSPNRMLQCQKAWSEKMSQKQN